eukprot:NODE_14_length_2413_cov_3.258515_g13_i0.p1 GENE.NODE_14_length_2413_cov_3.258515_g13_i0~~NODE_14_length_2413_cov_3.258515_g13_i0.p1  ORF type:complete len:243 (+),score=23.44 NODE_14_length_2413_cov_3.258515_g13_i0:1561-2289(+)
MNLTMAIPTFTGFYESLHGAAIDDEVEQSLADDSGHFDEDDKLAVEAMNAFHYTDVMRFEYARAYVRHWNTHVEQATGYNLQAKFSYLQSPPEYNFGTDRIFVKVPDESVTHMITGMDKQVWSDLIKERLEPRPGFAPFYSNDARSSDWDLTQYSDWRPAKLELICEAWLQTRSVIGPHTHWIESEIVSAMESNGEVHNIVWNNAPEKFVELANKRDALKETGQEGAPGAETPGEVVDQTTP